MSSTTTTWSTDTNTKSGSATTFTDTVSSLKLVGAEGEDAILRLFADEGDDNADQWRIVSQASTNKLNFMSFASGSWSNVLNLFGSGTAASQYLAIQAGNKLYLDGGTHTYIDESAADIMDFYAGGTHMLSLDKTNGEVAINEGSADINFRVEGNGDANLLFCDAGNDRVGIGTASPSSELHVKTTSGACNLQIEASAGGSADPTLLLTNNGTSWSIYNDDTDDFLKFYRSADVMTLDGTNNRVGIGTIAPGAEDSGATTVLEVRGGTGGGFSPAGVLTLSTADLTIVDGDVLGLIQFQAPLESGDADSRLPAASIWCEADATFQSGANNGELVFATANSETAVASGQERMRIDSAGLVGIGTSAPSQELHVVGDVRVQNTSPMIEFYDTEDTSVRGFIQQTSTTMMIDSDSHIYIAPNNATTVTFESTGDTGFGTTNPTSKIHVYKDADEDQEIQIQNSGNSLLIGVSDSTANRFGGSAPNDWFGYFGVTGNYGIEFGTYNTTRMTILANGNVGIGTTSAAQALEVVGEILSSSATGIAAGGGIDTVSPTISVGNYNSEIVTTVFIDIGAGLILSSGSAGDVIGEDGVANAYVTQITTAVNGLVYRGEIICLEVPTTGDPDVNICANSSGTIAEDAAGEGEHVLANCGVHTLGLKTDMTIPAGGIVNDYIYLTHGGTTAGTYDAGKFLIRFYGASVTSL